MTNGAAPPGPARKLPVVGTIVTTYGFVFRHLWPVIQAAAIPYVVALAGDLRLLLAVQEHEMSSWARLLWSLLPFVATIPFATQCQRYYLDTTPANRPRFGFPWSRRETAFLLHAVGLFGLMLLLNMVLFPLSVRLTDTLGSATGHVAGLISTALLMVLTFYIVARFTLVLPAAASGRNLAWGAAWRRAAGHGVGITLILFLTPLPWLIPGIVQMIMAPNTAGIGRFVVITAMIEACGLVSTATLMIALAAAYRWLTPGTGVVATPDGPIGRA